MVSEKQLPERLRWTLAWQTRKLIPALAEPGAQERLRAFWEQTRRMGLVLAEVNPGPDCVTLDIGGGLTTPLRWLAGEAICVDPLSEYYAARGNPPWERVRYVVGEGERLPMGASSVDLVVCTNCIDHTESPSAIITEIQRVLRPGGWFWFTCEENPKEMERNAGHPHALDRAAIVGLVAQFETIHAWAEPWRGVYRFLHNKPPFSAVEYGFLLRWMPS